MFSHLFVGKRLELDAFRCWRAFASGQKLQGADTVPADFSEQAESFGTC